MGFNPETRNNDSHCDPEKANFPLEKLISFVIKEVFSGTQLGLLCLSPPDS